MDPETKVTIIKEAIKQFAKPVREFVSAVVGPSSEEFGLLLADNIRSARFNRQLKIFSNANEKLTEAGIDPSKVDLKILVPLLEKASLEEDEDGKLFDMWSSLLAKAASGKDNIMPSYVSILGELSAQEARLLNLLHIVCKKAPQNNNGYYKACYKGVAIQSLLGWEDDEYDRYIENLFRVRILMPPVTKLGFVEPNGEMPFSHFTKETLCITEFGYHLIDACKFGSPDTHEFDMMEFFGKL